MKKNNGKPQAALVIDVGNTSTSAGLYLNGRILRSDRLDTLVRERVAIGRKLAQVAGSHAIDGVVLSSVVPAVNSLWTGIVRAMWPSARLIKVNHKLKLGVRITYPKPESIGADRLANACGAAARYGTPVIVADFGTAVTFDIVSRSEGYIGGVIAPGLPLMFTYLAEKTALLPRIEPGPITHIVGKSTEEAMRMGALWGYRGLVREILMQLKMKLHEKSVKLCATGGFADWILAGSGIPMPIDQDLTLFGLGRIYDLNR